MRTYIIFGAVHFVFKEGITSTRTFVRPVEDVQPDEIL